MILLLIFKSRLAADKEQIESVYRYRVVKVHNMAATRKGLGNVTAVYGIQDRIQCFLLLISCSNDVSTIIVKVSPLVEKCELSAQR